MILYLTQREKGLTSADFELTDGTYLLGTSHLDGSLMSMDGIWDITCFDRHLRMERIGSEKARNLLQFKGEAYRPYAITEGNRQIGIICHTSAGGLFSRYGYHRLRFDGQELESYSIGLGKEGVRVAIRNADKQLAQVEREARVINDLYAYTLYVENGIDPIPTVVDTLYTYVLSGFQPGRKVEKSVSIKYAKTTNKALLSKLDKGFSEHIRRNQ